jgi:hypothetical protein
MAVSNSVLKPLDIVVVKGKWFVPYHWAIMWRSMSQYSHCFIVKDEKGGVFDPLFGGILNRNVSDYKGREAAVCRNKFDLTPHENTELLEWVKLKQKTCKGYDLRAWLGFATCIKAFEDEDRWFCSEVPYWMFQENGYRLTNKDLTFPFPNMFVDRPDFEIIFEGKI